MSELIENKTKQSPNYGTPPAIAECVRAFLGGIDLDPCSSAVFNAHCVKATYFYDEEKNGLDQPWLGRVYLNPPGGRAKPGARAWWQRLVDEYDAGNIFSACYMSFALDTFQWSQKAKRTPVLSYPTIVFADRIKFLVENEGEVVETKQPYKPCALTWLPPKQVEEERAAMLALLVEILEEAGHPCVGVMPCR